MIIDDLYQFFGSTQQISNGIEVSRQTIYKWIERGYIPFKRQIQIEILTKGKLKATSTISRVDIYLPMFRYYDKKNGMCEVESLHFRKGKMPKIVYVKEGNRAEKFSAFTENNLMQAVNVIDSDGKNVYEGDILLLKNKEKFLFKSLEMVNKLKKVGKFKIIGNIFE